MVYKIGNGKTISLWYDSWSNVGPLSQFVTHRDIYAARLNEELKICDMINNRSWLWPEDWYKKFPNFTSLVVPVVDEDREDKIVWKNCRDKEVDFSVRVVNSDLNNHVQGVEWWKPVWYSQWIPKHTFILWLTIQDRLTTQDKLMKWGVQGANRCSLCQNESEDMQHLFFLCTFSSEVWRKVKDMAAIRGQGIVLQGTIVEMLNKGNGNNINSVVRKLMLVACVYYIWMERNGRIFKDVRRNSNEVY